MTARDVINCILSVPSKTPWKHCDVRDRMGLGAHRLGLKSCLHVPGVTGHVLSLALSFSNDHPVSKASWSRLQSRWNPLLQTQHNYRPPPPTLPSPPSRGLSFKSKPNLPLSLPKTSADAGKPLTAGRPGGRARICGACPFPRRICCPLADSQPLMAYRPACTSPED